MTRRFVALVLGAFLLVAGQASAASIGLTINGATVNGLPGVPDSPGVVDTLPFTQGYIYLSFGGVSLESSDVSACVGGVGYFFSTQLNTCDIQVATLGLGATFDTDPSISYALAVSNSTAGPLTYSFTFNTPFVGGPYSQLSQSFIATSLSAAALQSVSQSASASGLPPLAAVFCAGSPSCSSNPSSSTGVSNVGGSLSVFSTFTLNASESFAMNGSALLTGTVDTAVPEPTSLLLLGTGLAALARRRQRKS